jgi:hypothetical protein
MYTSDLADTDARGVKLGTQTGDSIICIVNLNRRTRLLRSSKSALIKFDRISVNHSGLTVDKAEAVWIGSEVRNGPTSGVCGERLCDTNPIETPPGPSEY